VPRAGEDFFNRLSSFLRDTLYVSAASDEQRCGHIRPTHKKSLQTLNGLRGLSYFLFGRDRAAHQSTVFFIWWAVLPNLILKKEPMICVSFPTSSSALRLSVWLFYDGYL